MLCSRSFPPFDSPKGNLSQRRLMFLLPGSAGRQWQAGSWLTENFFFRIFGWVVVVHNFYVWRQTNFSKSGFRKFRRRGLQKKGPEFRWNLQNLIQDNEKGQVRQERCESNKFIFFIYGHRDKTLFVWLSGSDTQAGLREKHGRARCINPSSETPATNFLQPWCVGHQHIYIHRSVVTV